MRNLLVDLSLASVTLMHVNPPESSWPHARSAAFDLGAPTAPQTTDLLKAEGHVLASALVALTDLPAFDTVGMDGWAVSGSGPWDVTHNVRAGELGAQLADGQAAGVATGAQVPPGTTSVLRREATTLTGQRVALLDPDAPPARGADIRRQGEEAIAGDVLLSAGVVVTPTLLGLAAAAGHDSLLTHRPPTIDVFVMGDELLDVGPSVGGAVRDSLSPQVPGWIRSAGGRVGTVVRLPDELAATIDAISSSTADVIMTTGGTAHGPVDQLHPALQQLHASLVIDTVAVRPGHPMVMARLPSGAPLLGLPGNPLAAAVTFVSIGLPLIAACRGLPMPVSRYLTLHGSISAPPTAHRLMPVLTSESPNQSVVEPLPHHGPAMLSGLAHADSLAVAPPGGAKSGDLVEVLPLPWS